MAIERMKLLSIVSKEENMNEFISKYLLESGLQPEDALKVFEKGWKLSCYNYNNDARNTIKKCEEIMKNLNVSYSKEFVKTDLEYTETEILKELEPIEKQIKDSKDKTKTASEEIENLQKKIYPISKLKDLKIDLDKLYNLKYLRYRYGKMPTQYFEKIEKVIDKRNLILFKIDEENDFVWIIYFTTKEFERNVDSYFNVMKFERIWLPNEFVGLPQDVIYDINLKIIEDEKIITNEEQLLKDLTNQYEARLIYLYRQLQLLIKINNVKKYMAHDEDGNFYIIGWIPTSELNDIMPKLYKEKDIQYEIKSHDEVANNPPTHLKNKKIFRIFETIVEMYGMPNYTEADPTVFVAVTTFLMFGFMFGDVGQGAIIALIGILLSVKKKSLGPIFVAGGISAIIFGVLYGSVFGKEDIIPALLIRPMDNITTMLISAIIFGVALMLTARLINLKNIINNKSNRKKKEKSSILEIVFGYLEKILSMISNTISFVRLAAFAINHVGLCMAVYILSNLLSGAGNILVAIIGNIIVIALEGLIVAIQVLRLEYYELFSRFYKGDGKPYHPIRDEIIE